jgi:PAS domain S-box-containing protein
MTGLCLKVCSSFSREVFAVKQKENFQDVEIETFPCACWHAEQNAARIDTIIRREQANGKEVVAVGGNCLKAYSRQVGWGEQVHLQEQCFYMFTDPEIVDAALREGAYLLTSGWLANWRQQMNVWGFEPETAKAFFSESASKLVLLDTGIDPDSPSQLQTFSDYVGLPYQILPVGLSHFHLFLSQIILKWKLGHAHDQPAHSSAHASQVVADYAMALDLLVSLTKILDETQVIQSILDLFTMLFAPKQVAYAPWVDDRPGKIVALSDFPLNEDKLLTWLNSSTVDETWFETDTGFFLRITSMDHMIGALAVEAIAFPEYKQQYLNLAIEVAHLCGLAIINARTYHRMETLNEELERRVRERTADLVESNRKLQEESAKRQRVVEALRESEARYSSVVSALTEGVVLAGADGTILTCNASAERILGLSREQLIGASMADLPWCMIHEDGMHFSAEDHPMMLTLRTGQPYLDRIQGLYGKNDQFSWISVNSQPLFHPDHQQPYGVVGSFSDITKWKQSEEQILNQVKRLSTLRTIDQTILGSLNLDVILQTILSETIDRLGVDAADILLLDPSTFELKYAAGKGFWTHKIDSTLLRPGEDDAGKALFGKKLVHLDDFRAASSRFTRADLLADEKFIRYYGVPLLAKGQAVGLLEVFLRKKMACNEEWVDFLETLAGQAAIAVDNGTLFANLQASNLELQQAYETTLEGWSHALDLRDRETEGHTQRVTNMTEQLARFMGIEGSDLINIRRGAMLHDIGKMGVPDHILLKTGKLTEEEWEVMKTHPQMAYRLLSPIAYLKNALDIPYCHHEKWDGTGYPRGLVGEQIPLAARIFAVLDVFDALTSDRPYRAAWSREKTIDYIQSLSGSHFQPQIVTLFLKAFQ